MSMRELLTLPSGDTLPTVGLGLWKIDRSRTSEMVSQAIAIGYRHLDAACDYGNEPEAGLGIRAALSAGYCRREDLWVTSKLWNTYHRPEHVRVAMQRTLSDMRLEYLDLYLIHFPIALKFVPLEHRYPPGWFYDPDTTEPRMEVDSVPIVETWQAMEELQRSGLCRHIGISNFNVALIRDLLSHASIRPAVLQVESHPYLVQEKLLRYCQLEQIAFTAFSPLGAGSYVELGMAENAQSVLQDIAIRRIASQHQRTEAQVVLRWAIQRGTAVVPKTSRSDRLAENLALFDFELSEDEMNLIAGLNRNQRFNDPGQFCESAFGCFYPIYE